MRFMKCCMLAAATLVAAACADSTTAPEPRQEAAPAPALAAQASSDARAANIDVRGIITDVLKAIAACKNGGYKNYTTMKGKTFRSELECVLYASLGGALVPIAPPPPPPPAVAITSFSVVVDPCGTMTASATFTGGTGEVFLSNGVGGFNDVAPITSGGTTSFQANVGNNAQFELVVSDAMGNTVSALTTLAPSNTNTCSGGQVPP